MDAFPQTERTRVRRLPGRARYDRDTVHAILDEGLVAHVGFVADGAPVVLPMAYVRDGDTVYLHGSTRARLPVLAGGGAPLCVTVTLLDGLVLARSSFHHSLNYRSVVIHGHGRALTGDAERRRALDLLVEHIVPGRTAEARGPNPSELKATAVIAVELAEVSAKVRTGGPIDDEADLDLPVWAGTLPLTLTPGPPEAATDLAPGIAAPRYVTGWRAAARP